jgi:hypothetical protein
MNAAVSNPDRTPDSDAKTKALVSIRGRRAAKATPASGRIRTLIHRLRQAVDPEW